MTAGELFLKHRERNDVALYFEDRTISYREWID